MDEATMDAMTPRRFGRFVVELGRRRLTSASSCFSTAPTKKRERARAQWAEQ
jgi:hypothetical protein